ncbi:glycosyltransferase family 4 protein [Bradyrhizobium jicamae]|nr:glycosyltransferase family 4 protein [Bradyrhizobium jicamae]
MAEIAGEAARDADVLVLSGTPGSLGHRARTGTQPRIEEIRNRMPEKRALARRATAEMLFTLRAFVTLLRRLRRGDVVVTVTAPFTLPYASVAAAWLRGARSGLIMHDLFPDVLVMSGLIKPTSLIARAIRIVNALMFLAIDIIITIGRDSERLLLLYRGLTPDKLRFIPNWATLPVAIRPVDPQNPFRRITAARFVVGLSGNLGFTHDPAIVFEAARSLREEIDIHFLLSGWGLGFEALKQLQAEAKLPNVSPVDRVADGELEVLLVAADVWIIPYRKNVAGISVPSRFYNLLAVGRPVILVSEPEAEAALIVAENRLGWVVKPGAADQLAQVIRLASRTEISPMAARAMAAAGNFTRERAMVGYRGVVAELLRGREGSSS